MDKAIYIEEFYVDFSKLDIQRPIGISGLMRVKDDSQFIEASVRSVIGCLDELIICYQDSSDNTEQVILRLKEEFSDKIRCYHYIPEIYSHNLNTDLWNIIFKLDSNSPYLLSNYYNYTLSKAKFKYGVKIDADQIYFTDKFQEICELYRSETKCKVSLSGKCAYYYSKVLSKLTAKFPLLSNPKLLDILYPTFLAKLSRSFIKQKIQNDKVVTSYEGLNIYYSKQTYYITGGSFYDGCQPPIGGCGDHLFFPINSKSIYKPKVERQFNRVIEEFAPPSKIYFGLGFLWLHLNAMRKNIYPKNTLDYDSKLISLREFSKIKSYLPFKLPNFILPYLHKDYKLDIVDIYKQLSRLNKTLKF